MKNTEQIDRRKSDRTTYRNLPVAVYAPPPDWRNLGIVLRSVLLVLLGLILVVLAAFPPALWLVQISLALSQALIPMIVVLLFAMLLNPWLAALERWQWISLLLLVAGLAAASLLTASTLLQRLQHGLLAVIAMGIVLMYLDLRGKAFSPALTEARLQALQARIRPHFLFNSLNSVLGLMRREPRKAETLLEDLSELFRALMRDNRELMPLDDEVRLTEQYLALEQQRLGARLNVVWLIEHMPADAMVPPLILQPLVENAVYHGIEPAQAVGELEINIFSSRNQVGIVVRNPYLLADGSHHVGNKMAVSNIRERLLLHFDSEANLKATVRGDRYEVRMHMPYKKYVPTQLRSRTLT